MQRLQHVVGQESPIMKVRLTNVLNANKAWYCWPTIDALLCPRIKKIMEDVPDSKCIVKSTYA